MSVLKRLAATWYFHISIARAYFIVVSARISKGNIMYVRIAIKVTKSLLHSKVHGTYKNVGQ